MTLKLPQEVTFILKHLTSAKHQAYVVGGAVRELLRENASEITDWDFTTDATPEQIQELFPNSFYENTFGTVSITPEHLWEMMGMTQPATDENIKEAKAKVGAINLAQATKIHSSLKSAKELPHQFLPSKKMANFEITTFRSEEKYDDHRRPSVIKWGKTLEEDLARRDFRINAMAIDGELTVIDPYHGQKDLKDQLIRTVGEPAERFSEDALRMLRAVRFSVQLNMKMTDETFTAVAALADDIQHVSWERIRDEFLKMLSSDYPAEAIELLDETGLLHFILPELREGKGVEQAGHHTTDVWTHSLDALRNCPSPDPIVRFATLLHDIAKPRTYRNTDGDITFYNHELVGARIAKQIGQRFRLSTGDCERLFLLVRHHMFYYQPHNTDAAIRRFMRKVGLENLNDILDLRKADRLGSGARKTSWRLEEMKQRMVEQLHQPFAITDLAINGTDLIEQLNLKPGRVIGQLLQTLFEEVMEKPELNTKEGLLSRAQELLIELQKKN